MNIQFENLGTVNKNSVTFYDKVTGLDKLRLWFSYETCVAFRAHGKTMCRKNDWSTTTGKLLNQIEPDKSKRIDGVSFEEMLKEIKIEVKI